MLGDFVVVVGVDDWSVVNGLFVCFGMLFGGVDCGVF